MYSQKFFFLYLQEKEFYKRVPEQSTYFVKKLEKDANFSNFF